MKKIILSLCATLAVISSLSAFEGGFDYADFLKNGGTFFEDKENPYIQKARVFGRFHYQYAALNADGESATFEEIRRTRLGLDLKFLDYFQFKGNFNVQDGSVNDIGFGGGGFLGYQSLDEIYLKLDLKKAFNLGYFDSADVRVEKIKVKISPSVKLTSKKIIAIERSAVADGRIRPSNSTGVTFNASKNGTDFAFSVFSDAEDNEFNFWEHGAKPLFFAGTAFDAFGGRVTLDGVYTLEDEASAELSNGENSSSEVKWGLSAAYETKLGAFDMRYNLYLAENNNNVDGNSDREGLIWGAYVQGSTFLTEKLQAVGRVYYWASTEEEGVRSGSRYAREVDSIDSTSGGFGQNHASAYVGLNYYFTGQRNKVMVGLEYESLDTQDFGRQDTTTLWSAYRIYF